MALSTESRKRGSQLNDAKSGNPGKSSRYDKVGRDPRENERFKLSEALSAFVPTGMQAQSISIPFFAPLEQTSRRSFFRAGAVRARCGAAEGVPFVQTVFRRQDTYIKQSIYRDNYLTAS